jgi:ribonuclease D
VPSQEWWRIPSALSSNKSQQLLFQRLCATRDALAKTLNVPPSHVLTDANVVAVIKSMPLSIAALSVHPALSTIDPEVRLTLLAPLYDPMITGELCSPPPDLDTTKDRLVSVLALYATALATELNIDRTILATKSDLTEFIQGRPSRLDVPWRRQILTDDIEKLLSGDAYLSLDQSRLSVRALAGS